MAEGKHWWPKGEGQTWPKACLAERAGETFLSKGGVTLTLFRIAGKCLTDVSDREVVHLLILRIDQFRIPPIRPEIPITVYLDGPCRGLDVILAESSYQPGKPVCWQCFSSSTKDLLQTLNFLNRIGNQLSGTLVLINSRRGRELELISQYPHELEVLFIENTFFQTMRWIKNDADKRAALPGFASYDLSNLAVLELTEM